MDRNRNNVVLSRRVVLEEGRKTERQAILAKLVKGQILPGVVSSIVDFGAFVDLGGIDGLVHISELSWSHVNHPSEVVQVGDKVEVKVLDVDLDRERISLGLKQTTDDPLHQVAKKFPLGEIVSGRVTKLVPFGVFVQIDDGVEGLVHISEMAEGHVEVPEDIVKIGDEVMVKVMDIDMDRRRISLSMRAAAKDLGIVIEVPERPEGEYDAEAEEAEEAEAAALDAADIAGEAVEAAEVAEAIAEEAVEEALEVEAAPDAGPEEIEAAEAVAEEAVAEAIEAEELAEEAVAEAIEAEVVAEIVEAEVEVEAEVAAEAEVEAEVAAEAEVEAEAEAELEAEAAAEPESAEAEPEAASEEAPEEK
jgi:small subunit ribosomal protein S1